MWSFAPPETLLEPPRRLGWTKWYVESVPKWFLFTIRCPATMWCCDSEEGSPPGLSKAPQISSIPAKSSKYCLWRVWVDGGAAAAAQMVRMDHLLCRECAEVVLMMFRWPAAVCCSVFGRAEPVGKLESTLITGKSPEIIQNGQILLCGVLRRRKLC